MKYNKLPFILFVLFQVILVETRLKGHGFELKSIVSILINTILIVITSRLLAKPGFERCPKPIFWILLPVLMVLAMELLLYSHKLEVILLNSLLFCLPGIMIVWLHQFLDRHQFE